MSKFAFRDAVYGEFLREMARPESIAEQLVHIARGEEVQDEFIVAEVKHSDGTSTGETVLRHTKRKVKRTPDSMARGLMLISSLPGMNLGLTHKGTKEIDEKEAYARFMPDLDGDIVHNRHAREQLAVEIEPEAVEPEDVDADEGS